MRSRLTEPIMCNRLPMATLASGVSNISGHATLAGSWALAFESGYTPGFGSYSFVRYNSHSGSWSVSSPPPPYGYWEAFYDEPYPGFAESFGLELIYG